MRFFTPGARQPLMPERWREALGMPSHVFQGVILVAAPAKADVSPLLTECGVDEWAAGNIASSLRVTSADLPGICLLAAALEIGFAQGREWRRSAS